MQHTALPPVASERRSLSTGAAARLASCHRTTILRAIARGDLRARRLGPTGDFRVPVDELDAWLQPTNGEETT